MKEKYGVKFGVKSIAGAIALTGTLLASPMVLADNEKMYTVSITNISKGISFTPILVVTHKDAKPVFSLGEPASAELVRVAEGGDTQPLQDKLMNSGLSYDAVSTGGLLGPGETVSVNVKSKGDFDHLSLASMLLPTNDGFIAINGMELPKHTRNVMVPGYDAGSEINDELCASIPGPYCKGDAFSMEDGEGFVHIHSGIHGINDLSAADYDWRNPIAKVTVKRMK